VHTRCSSKCIQEISELIPSIQKLPATAPITTRSNEIPPPPPAPTIIAYVPCAKLLLWDDMSRSSMGVSTVLSTTNAITKCAMDLGVKVLAVPAAPPWRPPDARQNVNNLLMQQSQSFESKQKIFSEEFELVNKALFTDHFSSLQNSDGHWPGDVNGIIVIMPDLDIAMVLVFAIGSVGVIFEESLAFNKGGVGLLMVVCLWVIRSIRAPSSDVIVQELNHTTIEVNEIVFFLIGAMTIVEIVDAHQGLKLVTDNISTVAVCTL
jgi:hypothetical protein